MTTIVFDIGNVLVRWDAHQAFLPTLGDRATVDAFLARIGFAAMNLRADGGETFADLSRLVADPDDRALFLSYLSGHAASIAEPIEGGWALLDRLRARGHPVHAITNWSAKTWPIGLATHPHLAQAFDVTIVSGQEGIAKPDPRLFARLCDRAGVLPQDCLFIDDTANAVSIRAFVQRTAGLAVTTATTQATVIQTRHRILETPLTDGQILIYQVPIPEPLRFLEPRETEARRMHALEEYGLMHLKLYEDIARHRQVATSYAYLVKLEGRYVMDPSTIPKFDNPKLSGSPAVQLFGAGREQRIYALPPWTRVVSLDFDDHPFVASKADHACDLCGARDSYLDEVVTDDAGSRMFVCSDTDHCTTRRDAGHAGRLAEVAA